MTGPSIPIELWPIGAVALLWNDEGHGQRLVRARDEWLLLPDKTPMPAGHDWRVPVMRHQPPAIDLEKIVPAEKKLPDLYMAEYHENKGWNACRAELLALIDGQANVRSSSKHCSEAARKGEGGR